MDDKIREQGSTQGWACICVLSDSPKQGESYARLIRSAGYVVECYENGAAFLEAYQKHTMSCLVIVTEKPHDETLEVQEALVERGFVTPVIFISADDDFTAAIRAMKRGALDFFVAPVSEALFLDTVRKAVVLNVERQEQSRKRRACIKRLERLTPREGEILALLLQGKMGKEIAYGLGIHLKTLDAHRSNILKKMQLETITQLIYWIASNGLLEFVESFHVKEEEKEHS